MSRATTLLFSIVAYAIFFATFLYLIVLTIVFSALGTIFASAVYVYATTGKAPGAIDPQLLQSTFRRK